MRDWLTHDVWWKIFSVFLALVIWVTVHKVREEPIVSAASVNGVTLTYENLPVQIVSTASDVRDFRVQPGVVSVKVSGAPDAIAVLQAKQIHAVVDLTDITTAQNLAQRVEVSVPPGITLVSVEPAEVGVMFPGRIDNK